LKRWPSEYVSSISGSRRSRSMSPTKRASAIPDRMDRCRTACCLVRLSALGFRRSAFRLQDAADRGGAPQIFTATPARSTSSDRMARHIVARTTEIPPGATRWSAWMAATRRVPCQWRSSSRCSTAVPQGRAARQGGTCVARLDLGPSPASISARGSGIAALRLARRGNSTCAPGKSCSTHRVKIRTYPVAMRGRRDAGQKAPMWRRRFRCMFEDSYVIARSRFGPAPEAAQLTSPAGERSTRIVRCAAVRGVSRVRLRGETLTEAFAGARLRPLPSGESDKGSAST